MNRFNRAAQLSPTRCERLLPTNADAMRPSHWGSRPSLAHVSSKATMMRLQGLEVWLRAIGSVPNETHKSAIRVYKGPHPSAPWLVLWSMEPRLDLTPFRNSSFSADVVKGVEIIEPQTTAKPAREGVKFWMRKELQGQITALEDHPSLISPALSEAKR